MTTWFDGLAIRVQQQVMAAIDDDEATNRLFASLWQTVASAPLVDREPATLQGQGAWKLLSSMHERLEREGIRVARRHAPAEWLWFVRRVPEMFVINELPSTVGYCEMLSACLAETSRREPSPEPGPTLTYRVNPHAIRSLHKLFAAVVSLYELHSCLRWSGKGAPIEFRRGERPRWLPSDELAEAVFEYDRREQLNPLAWTGLFMDPNILRADVDPQRHVPIFTRLAQPSELPIPGELNLGLDSVYGQYVIGVLDLEENRLSVDPQVPLDIRWPPHVIDLLALMRSVSLHIANFPETLVTLFHVGYFVTTEKLLHDRLDATLSLMDQDRLGGLLDPQLQLPTAGESIRRIMTSDVSLWPPQPGRPLKRAGNSRIIVDLASASHALQQAISRPTGIDGHVGNVWGDTFEDQIQDMIDSTPWRPGGGLRELVGRGLRLRGQAISDVDALAERDDVVILIDAKSRPYTVRYDRGEYAAVRANEAHAQSAAASWTDVIHTLRENPRGDNYDLSGAELLGGCVVYPFLPFIRDKASRREILDGLHFVSSAVELFSFLTGRSTDRQTELPG